MVYIVFWKMVDHTSSLIVVHRPAEMKTLLIFSALIGFSLPEKLDRTYLPPPGSKFSGGSPGAIDVPLELPKKTHTAGSLNNNFGRPDIAIVMNRVGSNISPEKYGDITSTVPLFQGNSYGFPTTTTSNALKTTSYLPASGSTIEPDVSINAEYPLNNSINITAPNYLREKNLSFDHTGSNKKQKLNDINDFVLGNQLPDNRISSQFVKNISDETQHFNNGDLDSIPEINSYSSNPGIPAIISTPAEIDHSLLSNNYDTHHNPPSSEPMGQHDANFIFSVSKSPDNSYSITPSKHVSTAPISNTNTPFLYHARPERIQAQDREAVILNYDNTITPDGFAYSFDTSNGIHADEKGIAINGVQALGSYSYIGDDGQLYSVNYTADENGFRPYGAHLPTAPPIPDAILKVIEQAAADKANGIYDDGSYDENKYGYKKYNPSKSTLRKYNKNREGSNLNRSKNNNKLLHKTRLADKLNKDSDTDKENEQNYVTKNLQQPYIKKEFVNGSVSEFSPNDKSEHFENKQKDSSNNVYNNNLQNKILSSVPHLKDIEKEDKIMSIELYENGYHYSQPQNDYSLETASKLLNRFPETPALIEIPAKYKKIVDYVPTKTFKAPYVLQNDDIFVGHDGDDQTPKFSTKYHEDQNDILNNSKTRPFVTLDETELAPGSTENIKQDFTKQFKQPGISPSEDQGYLYSKNIHSYNDSKNIHSYNDSNVPFISSTEIGLSDITSTPPTAFPSRSKSMESSKDNNSRLSKLSDSSLFQNQAPFANPSLDQEKYPETLTYSNGLDNYIINDDEDIIDSVHRYGTPSMYGDKDYIIEHSTPKPYGEDFGGPNQAQKFDPRTGYHY